MDTSSRREPKPPYTTKNYQNIGTTSRAMASPSEPKYHFNGKEDAKKFFYAYENVVMKTKAEEEKADSLVAYLDGEAFEYYFDNFTEDNALTRRPYHSRR